jgi:hypothetical protein
MKSYKKIYLSKNQIRLYAISNKRITMYTKGNYMVVRHSKRLLEQLSEIEQKIQALECFLTNQKMDVDQEEILRAIFNWVRGETPRTSES